MPDETMPVYIVYEIDDESGTDADLIETNDYDDAYEAWDCRVQTLQNMASHPSFTSPVTVYIFDRVSMDGYQKTITPDE